MLSTFSQYFMTLSATENLAEKIKVTTALIEESLF